MSAQSLAARLERLTVQIRRTIENNIGLSMEGQATAIAMLVTMNMGLLTEAADVLRHTVVPTIQVSA